MPRKGWVLRRKIPGDPVFGSDLVQKFISSMMYDGKRATAQAIFYKAMDQVAKTTNDDAFKLFKKAVENCKPVLEVKSRRVGGANYQVPVEVNPFRRQSLAIHWLVLDPRARAGERSRKRKACTAWRRPTRHSRTIGGKRGRGPGNGPRTELKV